MSDAVPPDAMSDAVTRIASRDSLTGRAVSAARAFEASLSSVQRAAVQYSLNSDKKSGWSSVPTNLVPRNGVAVSDLSARQRARLWALLCRITSAQGYIDETGVRKADTYLRLEYRGGTGLASKFDYGEGRYYVAFFGRPSRSRQWTVQFNGHHYTPTMTFSGAIVSNAPYFIGVNPSTAFRLNGHTYQPVADQAAAMFDAVRSPKVSQRATARLSQRFHDVLVGAGRDGQFPPKQGITAAVRHRLGTCAIEILPNEITPHREWRRFKQDIANLWTYKDVRAEAQRPPTLGQGMAGADLAPPARNQLPARARVCRQDPEVSRRSARDSTARRPHAERPSRVQ